MTPIDRALARIRELRQAERKMTPGPWEAEDPCDQACSSPFGCTPNGCTERHPRQKRVLLSGPDVSEYDRDAGVVIDEFVFENEGDAIGIAALRNAAPAMLDLLEALLGYVQYGWDDPRKEAEKMRAALMAFVEGRE